MNAKLTLFTFLTAAGIFFSASGVACPCEDRQIVGIILNTDELATAVSGVVYDRLQNPEVAAFAKNDIARHEANRDLFNKFAIDTGTPPEASDISKALLVRAHEQVAKLAATKTADLDKAYIDARLSEIQLELTALNTYWFPKAIKPELKILLLKLRPVVTEEFERISAIQKSLSAEQMIAQNASVR